MAENDRNNDLNPEQTRDAPSEENKSMQPASSSSANSDPQNKVTAAI